MIAEPLAPTWKEAGTWVGRENGYGGGLGAPWEVLRDRKKAPVLQEELGRWRKSAQLTFNTWKAEFCFPEGSLSFWESEGEGARERVVYQACDIRQAGSWSSCHKHPGCLPSVTGNWQPCPPLDASWSHPRSSSHISFPSLIPLGTRDVPSRSQVAQNVHSQ